MSLQKVDADFNFGQGVDSITDSNQLPIGKFTDLQNSTFVQTEGLGRLNKRFGFDAIASFSGASYITTYKGALLGIGNNVYAYSNGNTATVGYYQPLSLSVLPLNRNFSYPNVVDSARAPNGFIAYIYRSVLPGLSGMPTTFTSGQFYYSVVDGDSGQQMIPPTLIPQGNGGAQVYPGRVFSLNNKFVITYDGTTGSYTAGVSALNYITIDQTTLAVSGPTLLSNNYQNASSNSIQIAHDGFVANNTLYVALAASSSILAATINSAYVASAVVPIASNTAQMMSVTADTSSGITVFASFVPAYMGSSYKVVAFDQNLTTRFAAKPLISSAALSTAIVNITGGARNGVLSSFIENGVTNGTITNTPFNMITGIDVTINGTAASGSFTLPIQRQAGLASKAFTISSQVCFLSMYYGPNQSTYFLHGTSGTSVNVIGKMAYGNAFAQYNLPTTPNLSLGLPSANVIGSSAQIAFLQTISISNVNKATGVTGTNTALYSTPGINVSTWNFSADKTQASEIEGNLHLNGGYLWSYDGGQMVEHNFHLFPDKVIAAGTNGGRAVAQQYYYQLIYRWQDNHGNIHRSAPSVPLSLTLASGSQNAATITFNTPVFTQKNQSNPILAQCYRWSTNQQIFYKFPVDIVLTPSNFGTDLSTFADTFNDSELTGNEILYTNGGVVEDIGLPAVSGLALFDTRLWAISSEEDENVLFYSKPCVQSEPVEMSDLQTYFVPPNISGVPVPGGNKCIYGMDDKLLIFKKNAVCYINGIGPDATGAQNGYSNPILITNGVGCSRPNSIVLTPQGVMFQSDNGIWMIGRDLSVQFIGKEVEKFNGCEVKSAVSVPGTSEVRFTLGSSGQTLTYDYLVGQWNQQTNVPGLSSCIYQGKQAIISPTFNVSLQSKTSYADSGTPTTMKWTTGWISLQGLQGYVRAYRMYLLGKFLSPHTYTLGIAYDYDPTIEQTETIIPANVVGSGSYVEQWQVNFQNQQCQSFQLTFTEISSSTSGAGLNMSGVKVVYGAKHEFPRNLGIRNKV